MAGRLPEAPPRRVPAVGGPPLSVVPSGATVVGQEVLKLGLAVEGALQQRADEQLKRDQVKAAAQAQSEMNTFREQAFQTQDPAELQRLLDEELPKIGQRAATAFPFGGEEYQLEVSQMVERTRASTLGHVMAVRRADAQATVNLVGDAFVNDVSQIGVAYPELQALSVEQMQRGIESLDAFTPAEKAAMIERLGREGAMGFMGAQVQRDPAGVLEQLSSPELRAASESDPLLRFLSAADFSRVEHAARVEQDRQLRAAQEAEAKAQEQAYEAWLPRVYSEAAELPTVSDVLADPVLPASAKEHFIGVIERRARGENVNVTNPAIANDLYRRIHDPTRPDHITSFAEVLPFVGAGLSREAAEQYRLDIQQLRDDPVLKSEDRLLEEFFRSAQKQIYRPSMFTNDPVGARKFWEFKVAARREWDRVREEGKDPVRTLLDPTSPEYLQGLVYQYTPTMEESFDAMLQVPEEGALDLEVLREPAPPPPVQERKPGESGAAWLKRRLAQ